MKASLDVGIEGVGLWAAELPDWETGRQVLCGKVENAAVPASRPAPGLLAPTERRRAPESVLLAIEVAQQACAMAERDPRELPNVFASAYGDLAINDYLCATLVRAPTEISPTRFHNSVHNAPAGYWTIATGCMAASTAVSAGAATFGAGLLEAALLASTESCPVLLAAYDIGAVGPIADVVACRASFGVAFILAPPSPRAFARLRLRPQTTAVAELAPEASVLHASYRDNPAARSLPLLTALARRESCTQVLSAGPQLNLRMEILPWSK
ncbi:MAG: beta-ketoacyl synthase chain length factor [Rudaea sp.]|nr:beta-ketoacyl synthase chain length factor [Rudaea sp.]